jgi:hypothetical protein
MSPSQGRYLTQTQIEYKETSMPSVGFEPTIPVLERKNTLYALDRAASVMDFVMIRVTENISLSQHEANLWVFGPNEFKNVLITEKNTAQLIYVNLSYDFLISIIHALTCFGLQRDTFTLIYLTFS